MYRKAKALLLCTLLVGLISSCREGVVSQSTSQSADDREIVAELNLARTNPCQYARLMEEIKKYYRGDFYAPPNSTPIRMKEGIAAVNEAIRALNAMTPVPSLQLSNGLSAAARDHIADTGPRGILGHQGSDGSLPADRIERYGAWTTTMGENIAYGPSTAREIVMQLIIDDGVPDRGHRINLFEPSFRFVGVAFGKHNSVYKTVSVQDFAGGFIPRKTITQ